MRVSRATFFAFLSERTSRLRDGYGRREGGVEVSVVSSERGPRVKARGSPSAGTRPTSTDAVRARALARRTSRDMSFRPPPARRANSRASPRPSDASPPTLGKASFVTPPDRFSRRLPPPPRPTQGANARDVARTSESARKTSPFSGFVAPRSARNARSRPPRALSFPHPRAFSVASLGNPLTDDRPSGPVSFCSVEVGGVFQAVDANHENVVIADLDIGVGVVPVARVRWSDVLSITTEGMRTAAGSDPAAGDSRCTPARAGVKDLGGRSTNWGLDVDVSCS